MIFFSSKLCTWLSLSHSNWVRKSKWITKDTYIWEEIFKLLRCDIDLSATCSINRVMYPRSFFFFSFCLWSGWTWQQYRRTFFSVRPQESLQQSQLLKLTAWPLIKTVENEITPQIHHGRRWLSERSGAATHRMFTPGPLGLSALRVFLESRPDFSNGPRGFFSLLPPLLCYKPLSTPTPPSSVPDGVDRGLEWQGTPPPSPPPQFPTHSASLALHLLRLNGSWECCDVMQWCTERTAFPCFFPFPHPLAVPQIPHLSPKIFRFTPVCSQHPSCLSQVFSEDFAQRGARPVWQICCKGVHGVWGRAQRCTARHGQQFIYVQRLGTCLSFSNILRYFDSCRLKESKTAAVIRVRGKSCLHSCWIMAEC